MATQLESFLNANEHYDITTNQAYHDQDDFIATFRATVTIFKVKEDGNAVIARKVSASKTVSADKIKTSDDNSEETTYKPSTNYMEIAELGAISQCLTLLGYKENN